MHTVGQQRSLRHGPGIGQTVDDPHSESLGAVPLVRIVLGHVDVHPDSGRPGGLDATGERLVGEGERRMCAHHSARQGLRAGREATVLPKSREGARGPVTVRHLVAQHRAHAELAEGFGDHVERSVDEIRRCMMIDDGRSAGEQGIEAPTQCRGAH
jgi:hypothetical protein